MTETTSTTQRREHAIDRLFAAWDSPASPGAVVGVVRDGELIHAAGYGMACLAHGVALSPRSVVRIGSQTKQFCVLLALMLAAEGRLDLDDEVQRHAPWVPRFAQRVTLRHLVTNTGGMRDFLGLLALNGLPLAGPSTRADVRAVIAAHPELNFAPGAALLYSNSGFFIVSEILEAITDRSFDDLLQERICRPLGLRDTRLMPWDGQVLPRLAGHHTRGPDGAWHRAQWGMALGGEGGMVSTLEDLRVWLANFRDPVVGTPAMLAQLAAAPRFANGAPSPYGHGLFVGPYRGAATIGHSGGVAGGKSESVRFPSLGLDVIVLANCDAVAAFPLARRIADVVAGERLAPLPAAAGPAPANGLYRETDGEEVFAVIGAGEGMQMQTSLGAAPLRPVAPGVLAPEKNAVDLRLTLRGDGGFDAVDCGAPRRFRRVAAASGSAAGFAGRWRSTVGGLEATIEADGSTLRLRLGSEIGASRWSLAWIEPDLLMADAGPGDPGMTAGRGWGFVLRRAAEDVLVLSSERVRGVRFRRVGRE